MKQGLAVATLIIVLIGAGCRGDEMIKTLNEQTAPDRASTTLPPENPRLFAPDIERQLQRLLSEKVAQDDFPGVVFYIATSDGMWMGAAGEANRESKVVLKPTDRFRIGNLTNIFMAVLCLQLAEEGLLDLDVPIENYLPPEVSDRFPTSDRISTRQLLSHRSGLADFNTDEFQQMVRATPDRDWTAQEILEYAYDLNPATVRGAFSYANTNYLLAQLIIEGITGKPLAEVLRQRIQTPAGLTNTFLELREPIPGGFTQGYQDWHEDDTLENVTQANFNNGLGLGDRGIVSNAPDLVRFFQALTNSDKLLYQWSLEQMLETVPIGMGDGYGLGITHLDTRWGEAWGHTGRALGFQATLLYLPAHDMTVVVWMNVGDRKRTTPLSIAQEGLNIILGDPEFR
ncbi:serine hydrolase domain-containing protein [Thermocoleostomius sinensis]|uniref:Serine hydrolase n=1 Tax=Thermocoleostomius sinensis A174 TaxID=2016057 RepID=A0A9E8ZBF8_9CYAN|nr:serine hydrolase domain-containing protein [Thermocoleostomius sinensis]WAL60160.1 serine hydrolase [Thermocoleostomius sinensis A174]